MSLKSQGYRGNLMMWLAQVTSCPSAVILPLQCPQHVCSQVRSSVPPFSLAPVSAQVIWLMPSQQWYTSQLIKNVSGMNSISLNQCLFHSSASHPFCNKATNAEKSTLLTKPAWEAYLFCGFTRDFHTEELTVLKNKAKGLNSSVGQK